MIADFQQLLNGWAVSFDLPILDWIRANMTTPLLDVLIPIISFLGDTGMVWIIWALILLLTRKHRKTGLGMLMALLMGVVVCNLILKPTVARIRPYDLQETLGVTIALLVEKPHDFAFPSGHTIASFEACTVLLLANWKQGIPAVLLAIAIAFSRLYLYIHYPTDVITSVILGTIFGIIGYLVTHKVRISLKGKFLEK